MSDRGSYRAIKTVLLDGPDYQDLPEKARHVFLVLKLTFGPAGIEVHYPAALEAIISARTGMSTGAVTDALDVLEAGGWIERERNVVWVIGQLEYESSLNITNPNHRKSIARHVAGLPHLPIVARFCRKYHTWLEDTDGIGDGIMDSIPDGTAITEDRRPKTEDYTSDKSLDGEPSNEIHKISSIGERQQAYLQTFMPMLREVGLGTDDTNGSILKAIAGKAVPAGDVEAVIRGLPLLPSVAEMDGGELKFVYAKDQPGEPAWNRAKRAYYDSQKGVVSDVVKAAS